MEQLRRDKSTKEITGIYHNCTDFCSDLAVPKNWRSVLGCRNCKKKLTEYIADDMLKLITHTLRPHQQFIANAGSQPYATTLAKPYQLRTDLETNADEADMRIWLHCKKSCGVHKLIFSPDTDIYHIGLPIMSSFIECEIIVQPSKHTDEKARYLHMNNFIAAINNDPDLSQIPQHLRPQIPCMLLLGVIIHHSSLDLEKCHF